MQPQQDNEKLAGSIFVMALGLDSFSQIALCTAFQLHNEADYRLSSNENPNIIIVDIDDYDVHQNLDICKTDYPNVPVLALSINHEVEQNIKYVVLQKPIEVDTLFPALDDILKNNWKCSQVNQTNKELQAIAGLDNKNINININDNKAILPSFASTSYDYESLKSAPILRHIERCNLYVGLLGQVLKHLRRNENIVFGDGQNPVLILLATEKVFMLLKPLQEIKAICLSEDKLPIQKLSLEHPPLPGVRIKVKALIWQMAIWTASGRLIINITPDTQIGLRNWPNITRLAQIPDSIKILAFIAKTPSNLRVINHSLGIPLIHIINFIAAAYAIGILEKPAVKQHFGSSISDLKQKDNQKNLLSKFLRKVNRNANLE